MLEHIIESNKLKSIFTHYELYDKDITFIKEQIAGPLEKRKVSMRKNNNYYYYYYLLIFI